MYKTTSIHIHTNIDRNFSIQEVDFFSSQLPLLFFLFIFTDVTFGNQNVGRGRKKPAGATPWTCNYCLKSFNFKSLLQKHLRIHTGERPFKCTQCPKAFNQKAHLDGHQLVHAKLNLLTNNWWCDKCVNMWIMGDKNVQISSIYCSFTVFYSFLVQLLTSVITNKKHMFFCAKKNKSYCVLCNAID